MRHPRRLVVSGAIVALVASFLAALSFTPAQAATSFNYAEALQKSIMFYEAQASGKKQPWNRVEWRGDATLNDGKDVGLDLSGGWYDAGDHVKFGFPMAFTTTMLAWGVVANRGGYATTAQLTPMLNNLRWGTDYLIAAHPDPNTLYVQVGDGSIDHAYWGPPEVIDIKGMKRPAYKISPSCPGTDVAAETAAAMAASSLAFRPTDPAYADTLVKHARQLFTFADTTKGTDGQDTAYVKCVKAAQGYYTSTFEGGTNPGASKGYFDELAWAAAWLNKATGEASYLARAREFYPKMGTEDDVDGSVKVPIYSFGLGWNDKAYAVYALMAELTGEQQFITDAQRYLDYWTTGYKGKRGKYTPGGLAFIFEWGSLRMVSDTAWVALVFADYLGKDNPRYATYHDFAKRQIDYALGDNPGKHSYVVGFGANPPTHVHHRAASGQSLGYMSDTTGPNRHTIYGALAGGPNASDGWVDDRNDFQRNEVAIDYNAGFTAALGRLAKEYGGTPVPDSSLVDPVHDAEMTVEPTVYGSGVYGATIALAITNKTGWPPRVMNKAKARYFFTLDGSTTIDQVKIGAQSTSGCAVTGPHQYSGSTYYAELDCTGKAIYPGDSQAYQVTTGLKVDVTSPGTWDPANDWSASSAKHIVLYDDSGAVVFGTAPNGEGPQPSASRSASPSPSRSVMPSSAAPSSRAPSSAVPSSRAPSSAAPSSRAPSSAVPSSALPSSPAGAGSCSISYVVGNTWSGGASVNVTVKNTGRTAISGWSLTWDFTAGQQLSGSWNATVSQTGTKVTASNPASQWNGTLAAGGGSATFGFNLALSGANPTPTNFALNGAACS